MNPKVSYTLVGLFVLLLGSGLVTAVVWLSASSTAKVYDTYVAYVYESVSGLNQNAPVTYRGVDVGHVQEIAIDSDRPDRVRLMLAIEEGTPIKEDTVATLVTMGITGLAKVELSGGSIESPRLMARPGARYPEIQTGPSLFVRIDQAITTLVTSLESTTAELNAVAGRIRLLLSDQNQRAITDTLAHIDTITGALASRADSLQASIRHVEHILHNTAVASERADDIVQSAERSLAAVEITAASIDTTLAQFGETAQAFTATSENVNTLIEDVRADVRAFTQSTPAQVEQLLAELQRLSENLTRLTADLEDRPNMLFFGQPETPPGPGE